MGCARSKAKSSSGIKNIAYSNIDDKPKSNNIRKINDRKLNYDYNICDCHTCNGQKVIGRNRCEICGTKIQLDDSTAVYFYNKKYRPYGKTESWHIFQSNTFGSTYNVSGDDDYSGSDGIDDDIDVKGINKHVVDSLRSRTLIDFFQAFPGRIESSNNGFLCTICKETSCNPKNIFQNVNSHLLSCNLDYSSVHIEGFHIEVPKYINEPCTDKYINPNSRYHKTGIPISVHECETYLTSAIYLLFESRLYTHLNIISMGSCLDDLTYINQIIESVCMLLRTSRLEFDTSINLQLFESNLRDAHNFCYQNQQINYNKFLAPDKRQFLINCIRGKDDNTKIKENENKKTSNKKYKRVTPINRLIKKLEKEHNNYYLLISKYILTDIAHLITLYIDYLPHVLTILRRLRVVQ